MWSLGCCCMSSVILTSKFQRYPSGSVSCFACDAHDRGFKLVQHPPHSRDLGPQTFTSSQKRALVGLVFLDCNCDKIPQEAFVEVCQIRGLWYTMNHNRSKQILLMLSSEFTKQPLYSMHATQILFIPSC